jgi:hypothetical protein
MCVPNVSAIEIQTTGPISMKFGMSILLNGGKVHSWDSTPYPNPQGQGSLNRVFCASAASTVRFGENLIKQKL